MSSEKKRSAKATFIGSAIGLVALASLVNPLWTDPAGAAKTLDDGGFTNIETKGYSWFGCGKGDVYHTEFKAKNPQGKEVTGVVCRGFAKSSTIRFD